MTRSHSRSREEPAASVGSVRDYLAGST